MLYMQTFLLSGSWRELQVDKTKRGKGSNGERGWAREECYQTARKEDKMTLRRLTCGKGEAEDS